MEILEKVAYMKGLAEGLGLDTKSKEGKLMTVMIDILDDVALELQDLHEEQDELEEALDAVSDDLGDVEEILYDDDDADDDDEVYESTCPSCGEEVYFDEDVLADGCVACPHCGETLAFDLTGESSGNDEVEIDSGDDGDDEDE